MRVLLTGSHDFLGKLVLARLRKRDDVELILTVGPGAGRRGLRLRHERLALNDPKIVALVRREAVDTIVHLDVRQESHRNESDFEHTVMGSMTLLAAAAEAGVRKVLMRSTAAVYGARYSNPTYLDESRRIRLGSRSQYLRDLADVERYAQEFVRSHPEVFLTMLRFAPVIGPTATSPFMRYVRLEQPPVIAGFDPLFQLLHEEDAADAVAQALSADVRGPVNIGPEGVTPLLRILRRLGRSPLPIPPVLTSVSERLLPPLRGMPMDSSFLKFPCCPDNGRMKRELGFLPSRTTSQTLEELSRVF
ncbi:MAG: NAD-dependent epimerase/dehydratase family protein [Planctomycetes bacterium]|nr:NAD-dependent epimerase/dehydratase family protein [Planctomycetota bacterium]